MSKIVDINAAYQRIALAESRDEMIGATAESQKARQTIDAALETDVLQTGVGPV